MPLHPRIPQHVYVSEWEKRSQEEFSLMYEDMAGRQNDLHIRAVFNALAQAIFTDCHFRFPHDGDLTITVPRGVVEQLYQDMIARLQGEYREIPRPATLALQKEMLRCLLHIVEVPLEVWERWGYPKEEPQEEPLSKDDRKLLDNF